jgi:NAD(P)-dependent dehydrogenase (short-subunit alcohol dehydrogenase family)
MVEQARAMIVTGSSKGSRAAVASPFAANGLAVVVNNANGATPTEEIVTRSRYVVARRSRCRRT